MHDVVVASLTNEKAALADLLEPLSPVERQRPLVLGVHTEKEPRHLPINGMVDDGFEKPLCQARPVPGGQKIDALEFEIVSTS